MLNNSLFPQQQPSYDDSFYARVNELNQTRAVLEQQKMQMQAKPNAWGELDNEIQSLNAEQKAAISKHQLYVEEEQQIAMIVQAEILEFIKPRILANQSYVQLLNAHTETIRRFKKEYVSQEEIELNELRDYKANYANISFEEYLAIKNKKTKK